jgi:hypothetical protein
LSGSASQYKIGAYPLLLYACHCTDCQRQSGNAFAMKHAGSHHSFPRHTRRAEGVAAGVPLRRSNDFRFCGDCGGRINGDRASRPGSVNLRAGSLRDTTWLAPAAQIFV